MSINANNKKVAFFIPNRLQKTVFLIFLTVYLPYNIFVRAMSKYLETEFKIWRNFIGPEQSGGAEIIKK